MPNVIVSGDFDDLRSRHVRLLEEAARWGDLHVYLWPDEAVQQWHRKPPKFPLAERLYFLNALRFVKSVAVGPVAVVPDALSMATTFKPDIWVVDETSDTAAKRDFCQAQGITYKIIKHADLAGFPSVPPTAPSASSRKKVIVTGCYDWFHSGHIRFFEEVSELGDLYVAIGNDANVRNLKGEGHPMFSQEERQYLVGAIRYVKQALITSGWGWLDAEPEIRWLKPDIYAVNEDGDRPEKREFCEKNGIQYAVLKRLPKPGLPQRQSTVLRGF